MNRKIANAVYTCAVADGREVYCDYVYTDEADYIVREWIICNDCASAVQVESVKGVFKGAFLCKTVHERGYDWLSVLILNGAETCLYVLDEIKLIARRHVYDMTSGNSTGKEWADVEAWYNGLSEGGNIKLNSSMKEDIVSALVSDALDYFGKPEWESIEAAYPRYIIDMGGFECYSEIIAQANKTLGFHAYN